MKLERGCRVRTPDGDGLYLGNDGMADLGAPHCVSLDGEDFDDVVRYVTADLVRLMPAYPPVGKVALMRNGDRILVQPHEGTRAECFTGVEAAGKASSTMYRIDEIEKMVKPTKRERIYR